MAFSLNETTLLSAVNSGNIFSIINSTIYPSYSITYNTIDESVQATIGAEVFSPTGWVAVEPSEDASIVNAPIESVSYTSYNKVKRPSELRVVFTQEGSKAYSGSIPNLTNFTTLSNNELITTLKQMMITASTYNIETPNKVYESYDLAHYDFRVSHGTGITLLTVNATFYEVLQTADVSITTGSSTTQVTNNTISNSNSAASTNNTQSSTKSVTIDSVKTAWTSANTSLSSALSQTGNLVVSDINSAADMVAENWTSDSAAVSSQIKKGISDFVGLI